jgi:hypothetical protein
MLSAGHLNAASNKRSLSIDIFGNEENPIDGDQCEMKTEKL